MSLAKQRVVHVNLRPLFAITNHPHFDGLLPWDFIVLIESLDFHLRYSVSLIDLNFVAVGSPDYRLCISPFFEVNQPQLASHWHNRVEPDKERGFVQLYSQGLFRAAVENQSVVEVIHPVVAFREDHFDIPVFIEDRRD